MPKKKIAAKKPAMRQTHSRFQFDKAYLNSLIEEAGGINYLSEQLGIPKASLYKMLNNFQLPVLKPMFDLISALDLSCHQWRQLFQPNREEK